MTRYVLVTGASSGIGEATALLLARRGILVAAGVRNEADGERLRAAGEGRIRPVPLDVTDESAVDAALATVAQWTGGVLHGVVNNAGIVVGGPTEFLPLQEWRDQFEVNVIGAVSVTRSALPLLRASGGRVVMVGSNSGRVAVALLGPYCASKHALEAVAESLRLELRPSGLPVVLVEPGAISTPIWEKGRRTVERMRRELPSEALGRYAEQIRAIETATDAQERNGLPPERVAETIAVALTCRRPCPRYQVGVDAVLSAALDRFVPDRLRAPVISRLAGP